MRSEKKKDIFDIFFKTLKKNDQINKIYYINETINKIYYIQKKIYFFDYKF